MELLAPGMGPPAVLETGRVDSEKYTGFAWGMGPHRIAMSRHGIADIRLLYDSDVRFLAQFAGGGRGAPRAPRPRGCWGRRPRPRTPPRAAPPPPPPRPAPRPP